MEKKVSFHEYFSIIDAQLRRVYNNPVLARQYTLWILEAITHKSEAELLTQQLFELSNDERATLDHWLSLIVEKKMPLQYLLGFVPFNDLNILVEPPILLPRPETEEWAARLAEQLQPIQQPLQILDLCTGTGCIALTLARALSTAFVVATDISQQAVELCKKNCAQNQLANVSCKQGDLFEPVQETIFDLIVGNPPYIDAAEWDLLDDSVKKWEDKKALIAPDHGLFILKKIIAQAPRHLRYNEQFALYQCPQLILEIDYTQGNAVRNLMEEAGFVEVMIHKDLSGKDRVVSGRI